MKQILFDEHQHWEAFKKKYGARIRPIVIKEVEKFRDCGNLKNGFKLFVYEGMPPHAFGSLSMQRRFCTTCSVGESEGGVGYLQKKYVK
ncbi:transposase zinc-binding domain-containing protein [Caldifermentibacillus hisashii]|uniref:transposase zinc-binding domain-containing protein n=1 Tax=Caldifermentibacillus hisashii TaxID=996558 RepID=UPI00159554E3|nr:transposase zinc-binding domain-containing protein [Caldifermentibacillus hisashii]